MIPEKKFLNSKIENLNSDGKTPLTWNPASLMAAPAATTTAPKYILYFLGIT